MQLDGGPVPTHQCSGALCERVGKAAGVKQGQSVGNTYDHVYRPSDEQAGSYRFVPRIGTDKRACIDWSGTNDADSDYPETPLYRVEKSLRLCLAGSRLRIR